MFRPPSLLVPHVVPTAASDLQGSRDFYIRAERASSPRHATDMLAVRIQAIDGARTFTLQDSQPCRLLPLQGNNPCGVDFVYNRQYLFPSAGAMPTVATGVPAFILYNINKPVFYADSGTNGAFIIRTGPAFGASNIVATGTKATEINQGTKLVTWIGL